MDMKTRYLGLELKNPLVASASPINLDLDAARHGTVKQYGTAVFPQVVNGFDKLVKGVFIISSG